MYAGSICVLLIHFVKGSCMQGSIFTALSDMVIEKLGMPMWDEVLTELNPASGGIYTAGQQYEDAELLGLVALLSQKTNLPATQLVEAFGEFLFSRLYNSLPPELRQLNDLRPFLLSVDKVIHKEVRRLYPDAYLPSFDYDNSNEQMLVMYYQSRRKLCHAAVGLIKGAAAQFSQQIQIEHPECMHDGAERCRLHIHFHQP